jgi:hypothetical protein
MLKSQGLTEKLYPWEESIRVPLLVRYPRALGRVGHRSQAPVNSPDLMPTLLSLAGIPVPPGVQGTDYSASPPSPAEAQPPDTAFLSLPVPITTARAYGIAEYRGVRSRDHTYVRSIHGPWLLYNNQRDPYQMHNLCGHEEARAIQETLDAELNVWLETLNDEFLPADQYLQRDHLTNYLEPYSSVGHTRSPWNDWESTMSSRACSIDAPLGSVLANPAAKAVVQRELPDLPNDPNPGQMRQGWISLRLLQRAGFGISEAKLDSIEAQLAEIDASAGRP